MDEQIEITKEKKSVKIERIIGIVLLIPPTLSVLLFILNLLFGDIGYIPEMHSLSAEWTGDYGHAYDAGGGGYTSAAPIYLGLMAIAGAILLKGTDKK